MNKPYDQQNEEIKLFGLSATKIGSETELPRYEYEVQSLVPEPIFIATATIEKLDDEIQSATEKDEAAVPEFLPEVFDFSKVGIKPEKSLPQKVADRAVQAYYATQFSISTSSKVTEISRKIEATKTKKKVIGAAAGLAMFPVLLGGASYTDELISETTDTSSTETIPSSTIVDKESEVDYVAFTSNNDVVREDVVPVITSSASTTTTTTVPPSTTLPTTTTQPSIPNTTLPNLNEYGMPKLVANFRGAEIDCNGRYQFGTIANLWLSTLVRVCDGVNGDEAYTLTTLLNRNPHIPQESGTAVLDYIKDGQLFNLGPNLPPVDFIGLRDSANKSTEEGSTGATTTSSQYSFSEYKEECKQVGGVLGSSKSPTLTEYIIAMGGTSAIANNFSKLHPELAWGWSRFGNGNYCLTGNVDLLEYDS